jgi:predicted permease
VHHRFVSPLLRQTLRRLTRERGFTLTVLLTLGLCIGANVAIFAVVDAILVRSLPFPHADRLVITRNAYPGAGVERHGSSSLPNYYDRREHVAAFESTAIYQRGSAIVGEAGAPARIERDRVSPEFFATLGVPIAMGRTFTEDEMLYANAQVLILTHEFWQSHFNGDPNVLGRELMVDNLQNTVVGVLPPKFRFLDSKARFFIPLASNLEDRAVNRRHSNGVQLIARLKSGVSVAEAQAQIDAFNAIQLQDDPYAELLRDAGYRTNVHGLHADTVSGVRDVLLLLQAGVFSLLLIGGVNLVNLLLIRASGRAKELAVRQALGASRSQVARETVLETVLLALGGGLLGLGLGALSIRLLDTLGTDRLPLGVNVVFDGRVAVVSIAASVIVGIALALPIVAFNLRRNLAPALHAESRGGTVSRAAQQVRHAFIVVQVALAFMLLSGAGLLGLSLRKILATSPGFQADRVLTASLSLPWKNYPEPAPRQAFLERLLTELRQLPGVVHAGVADGLPFAGSISDNATAVEGVQRAPGESIRTHFTSFAMGDYWQALGIPLIEGRYLEEADNHREQRVCVVDQVFAQRYWPGQSALGRRIANDVTLTEENAITIVGVVGTVKQRDLTDNSPLGSVQLPYRIRAGSSVSIVIRTAMAPESMGASLQKLVLSLDPQLPVDDIKVLQERIDDSLVARRSPAMLVAIFASVALLLAAIGTYGVLAYAVNQRRREIGVRMALGALPSQVFQQFLGLGARLLLVGVGLGLIGAWAAGWAMRGLLFDVQAFHAGIATATAGVMVMVVLLATLLPSQRAARVSPIEALRDD